MDFVKFYDEQHDYAAFRSNPQKLEEYKKAIQWKVENLVKTIPAEMHFNNALEVGCALGILLNNLADKLQIKNRFGIDISAENIQFAKKTYPNSTFVCGTIDEIKENWNKYFSIDKFDIVFLSDIIEHIPNDEEFLKEISTITDYVLLNLPLEKCFNTRNRNYGELDPSGHLRCYNLSDARKLIKNNGFIIISEINENAHFSKEFFKYYKEIRQNRVKRKPLLTRLFWSSYYSIEELVKNIFPTIYMKKYGSNYFALLKADNK